MQLFYILYVKDSLADNKVHEGSLALVSLQFICWSLRPCYVPRVSGKHADTVCKYIKEYQHIPVKRFFLQT